LSLKGENTDLPVNEIFIKTYVMGSDILVAACDTELIGKTLEHGEIKFEVSRNFYYGIRGDEKLLETHLRKATIANLVGKRCIGCGIRIGLISKENVLNIGEVPHAQFALMI